MAVIHHHFRTAMIVENAMFISNSNLDLDSIDTKQFLTFIIIINVDKKFKTKVIIEQFINMEK